MADQLRYDMTKSKWLQAAKEAQSQKDQAREAYDSEKSEGLTNDSFTNWANMNYPALLAAYSNYREAEAGYMSAWANLDSSGLQEWQQKRQQKLLPLEAKGGDESQFIIYTDAE